MNCAYLAANVIYALFTHVVCMLSSGMDKGQTHDRAAVLRASVFFSVSSIGMILVNKAAATVFANVFLLLMMQNLATILILVLRSQDVAGLSAAVAREWAPCAVLFSLNIFSSLKSLSLISVATFTILRNTQPLCAVVLESVCFRETYSTQSIVFLAEVLVGAVLYSSHDVHFHAQGYAWAGLHVLSMTLYSVLVKHKSQRLKLTAAQMSYYNNVLSIPFLLLSFVYTLHWQALKHSLVHCLQSLYCIVVVLGSCVCGYLISVSGFMAQEQMSPTSWLCLNNFSKIPAIIASFFLFRVQCSVAMMHGIVVSCMSAYLYALSRKHDTSTNKQFLGLVMALSCLVWLHRVPSLADLTATRHALKPPKKDIYLYHESNGRLGNQLFQFASMDGIARRNHARLCLQPSYRWYAPFQNYRIQKAFEEFNESFMGHNTKPCTVATNIKYISGDKSFLKTHEMFKEDVNVGGYLETFRYFEPFVRSRLRFKTHILHNAKQYMSSFKDYTTVGVHVRFYETTVMNLSDESYFQRAMNFMRRKHKNVYFIVTSDNMQQCAQMQVFAKPNVHLVQRSHDPVLDMAILAQCKHIILSTGTFGWWSAFLGADLHGGLVVYDRNGMGDWKQSKIYNYTDYYFEHWIGL